MYRTIPVVDNWHDVLGYTRVRALSCSVKAKGEGQCGVKIFKVSKIFLGPSLPQNDRELEITKFNLEGCNCIFHACIYILDGG